MILVCVDSYPPDVIVFGSCIMIYDENWLLARNDAEIKGSKRHSNCRLELKGCIQQGQKRE
ncbi:hypothetical protein HanIR_Chr09g0413401 [Helianthus annuus]|nr:hypothetical protein HanIR_Chr09g0413401 [Helianthus annuus]